MNEQQWLTCRGPRPMLAHLRTLDGNDYQKLSAIRRRQMLESGEMRPIERKLRMFACYCQRKKYEYYGPLHPRLERGDGMPAMMPEWLAPMDHIEAVERGRYLMVTRGDHTFSECSEYLDPERACKMLSQHRVLSPRQLVATLRDIFGNPFRPAAFPPSWRTDTAVTLARQMYDARDFGAMPILADALQDAGCDDDDVLNHCRDTNASHVRGCWVVDLVLGRG